MKRGRGGGSNKKSANKKPRMRQTASTKGARQTAARTANQKSTRNGANNGAAGRKTALSRKKNHREEDQGQLKWNDEDLVEFRAVPRVSVNDPDVSSILRQNRESGTPVVLTGAVGWTEFARPWLKLSDDEMNDDDSGEQPLDLSLPYKLDIDGMIKDIGDEKVRVISKGSDELNRTDGTTTVRQFLQSSWPGVPGRKSKQKKYLHQWQFPTSDSAAAKLCHKNLVPQNVFGDDLFELAAGNDDIPYQYLFMGPVNTQSTNHCDRGGMDISIAPILGEKEVILTHRDHGSMLYQLSVDFDNIDLATYPLLAHAKIWKTTIKPGEILFMPHGTYHDCRNVTPCLSYSRFHLDVVNVRAFADALLDGDEVELDHAGTLSKAALASTETLDSAETSLDVLSEVHTLRVLEGICRHIGNRVTVRHRVKGDTEQNDWAALVRAIEECLHRFRYRDTKRVPRFVPKDQGDKGNGLLGLSFAVQQSDVATFRPAVAVEGAAPALVYESDVESAFVKLPDFDGVCFSKGDTVGLALGDTVTACLYGKRLTGTLKEIMVEMDGVRVTYEDYPGLYDDFVPFGRIWRPRCGEENVPVGQEEAEVGMVVVTRDTVIGAENFRAKILSIEHGTFYQVEFIVGGKPMKLWLRMETLEKKELEKDDCSSGSLLSDDPDDGASIDVNDEYSVASDDCVIVDRESYDFWEEACL